MEEEEDEIEEVGFLVCFEYAWNRSFGIMLQLTEFDSWVIRPLLISVV